MDTRWKNRVLASLLYAAGCYLLALFVLCAVDLWLHRDMAGMVMKSVVKAERSGDSIYYASIRDRLLKEALIGAASLAAGGFAVWQTWRQERPPVLRFTRLISRPADARGIAAVLIGLLMLVLCSTFRFFHLPLELGQLWFWSVLAYLTAAFLASLQSLTPLFASSSRRREEWENGIILRHIRLYGYALSNVRLLLTALAFILMTGLAGGMALALLITDSIKPQAVLYILLYMAVAVPAVLYTAGAYAVIRKGAGEMANGNLQLQLDERYCGPFDGLAASINSMKDGYMQALEEQVKSERLKTELITNVSHDLKTPLTSIVNYVDLLQREGLDPDTQKKYLEVLTQKTNRLKLLIDDLFEASKMASGAVELELAEINVTALLEQALAEFNDKIGDSSLSFRVKGSGAPMYARLDGRKTWRVFENLIGNALKYSQPGTRVYIELEESGNSILFTMKNVSAYEIDFQVEELMERFKRADSSRSTEGSGLGLAIARSIVELQGGSFRIELDGDVFKVLIRLPKQTVI